MMLAKVETRGSHAAQHVAILVIGKLHEEPRRCSETRLVVEDPLGSRKEPATDALKRCGSEALCTKENPAGAIAPTGFLLIKFERLSPADTRPHRHRCRGPMA